jgi:hypothetical protein
MTAELGLEIALLGAMDRVRASVACQDFAAMLAATRRLQALFAEVDRADQFTLAPLAQQACELVEQVLGALEKAEPGFGAARPSGPRAAYVAVEGLTP